MILFLMIVMVEMIETIAMIEKIVAEFIRHSLLFFCDFCAFLWLFLSSMIIEE